MEVSKLNIKGNQFYFTDEDAQNKIEEIKDNTYTKEEVNKALSDIDESLKDYVEEQYQPKGDYLTEHQSLDNYYTKEEVNNVIDAITPYDDTVISDRVTNLEKIDHSKYLTQHQNISDLATKAEVKEVENKVDAIEIPNKVSMLENDSKYQTQSQVDERFEKLVGAAPEALDTLEEIADRLKGDDDSIKAINSILTEKADRSEIPTKVSQLTNDKGYLTEHQSLANYYTKSDTDGKFLPLTNYNASDILNKLKSVDGSGSGLDADLLRGLGTSSNGDPNTIPVINENGMLTLQGIKTNPVVGEISEEGWYNVYRSDNDNSLNNECILLNVSSKYGSYLLAITFTISSSPSVSMVQLNGDYDINVIPEIEVVTNYSKKNVVRIKYVPVSSALAKQKIYISGIGRGTFNAPFPESGSSSSSKRFNFSTTKGFKTTSNLQELTNDDLNELEGLTYNSITNFYGALRNTCLNKPTDYHFFLTVSKYDGVEFQTYYDSDGVIWIRKKSYSVWTEWEQVATLSSTVEKAKAVVEQVLTNEDLNNLNWEVNTIYFGEEGNSCINKPSGVDAFTLCNYGSGKSSFVRMQVLYPNSKDGSEMFMRVYARKSLSSFEWKPWKKILTEDDLTSEDNYNKVIKATVKYDKQMESYGSGTSVEISKPFDNIKPIANNIYNFILRLTITDLPNGSETLDIPISYDTTAGTTGIKVPISFCQCVYQKYNTFFVGSFCIQPYRSGDYILNQFILKEV